MEFKSVIQRLEEYGKVEIINSGILTFQKHGSSDIIYLRYALGETYHFLKGDASIKVQIRVNANYPEEKFSTMLGRVIKMEINTGSKVKEKYLTSVYLSDLVNKFSDVGIENLDLRTDKIIYLTENYRIIIASKDKITYSFTNEFLKVNDIDECIAVTQEIKDKIEYFKSIINEN